MNVTKLLEDFEFIKKITPYPHQTGKDQPTNNNIILEHNIHTQKLRLHVPSSKNHETYMMYDLPTQEINHVITPTQNSLSNTFFYEFDVESWKTNAKKNILKFLNHNNNDQSYYQTIYFKLESNTEKPNNNNVESMNLVSVVKVLHSDNDGVEMHMKFNLYKNSNENILNIGIQEAHINQIHTNTCDEFHNNFYGCFLNQVKFTKISINYEHYNKNELSFNNFDNDNNRISEICVCQGNDIILFEKQKTEESEEKKTECCFDLKHIKQFLQMMKNDSCRFCFSINRPAEILIGDNIVIYLAPFEDIKPEIGPIIIQFTPDKYINKHIQNIIDEYTDINNHNDNKCVIDSKNWCKTNDNNIPLKSHNFIKKRKQKL